MSAIEDRPIGFGRLKRKEDARFIRGKGNYLDDIRLPGMVHAAFVQPVVQLSAQPESDFLLRLNIVSNPPFFAGAELVAQPVVLTRTPSTIQMPPPACGEHTDEILAEYGYNQAEIDRLRQARVI